MRRPFLRNALAAVLAASAFACGEKSPTGIITPPPPPPVTLLSLVLVVESTIVAPVPKPIHVIAKYSDGTEKDVTSSVTFKTLSYGIADVTLDGYVVPQSLGSAQIQGTFGGLVGLVTVKIVGTLWSQLPFLSATAKLVIKTTIASNGMTWLWKGRTSTKVWHNSTIPHAEVVAGLNMIDSTAKSKGSKFEYVFVADSASAEMRFALEGPNTPHPNVDHCGSAGSSIEGNTRVSGTAWIVPTVNCMTRLTVAHEALHMMGIMGHTKPGMDVLSAPDPNIPNSPSAVWMMTEDLAQAIYWIFTVVSGIIPIDP